MQNFIKEILGVHCKCPAVDCSAHPVKPVKKKKKKKKKNEKSVNKQCLLDTPRTVPI